MCPSVRHPCCGKAGQARAATVRKHSSCCKPCHPHSSSGCREGDTAASHLCIRQPAASRQPPHLPGRMKIEALLHARGRPLG